MLFLCNTCMCLFLFLSICRVFPTTINRLTFFVCSFISLNERAIKSCSGVGEREVGWDNTDKTKCRQHFPLFSLLFTVGDASVRAICFHNFPSPESSMKSDIRHCQNKVRHPLFAAAKVKMYYIFTE